MSKIKILSEHLANQIAAGEVIERPASVVKEFIENSLDAGAGRIAVQVAGGGSRLIRVVDDGCGMDEDDVLLCLERHATSKLGSADDGLVLAAIRTLGFRGEAIPSIGSVSQLSISSRTEGAELGTRAEVRYGKLVKVHESGCARGTVMEMRDLFGNLPARRKFLKSARTELFHIEEVLRNAALAHPETAFALEVDGRTVFDLPPGDDAETRLRRLYNWMRGEVLRIAGDDETNGIGLRGFLLPPDEAHGASTRLRLFVNNRPVKDRMLTRAVHDGLSGFLMKGRAASGVLFVTLAPERVDVNVHPTKQEIRFQQPERIHRRVLEAVTTAVQQYQEGEKFALFGAPRPAPAQKAEPRQPPAPSIPPPRLPVRPTPAAPSTQVVAAEADSPLSAVHQTSCHTKVPKPADSTSHRPSVQTPPRPELQSRPPASVDLTQTGPAAKEKETAPAQLARRPPPSPVAAPPTKTTMAEPPAAFAAATELKPETSRREDEEAPFSLRAIGQVCDLYILCERQDEEGRGLVVIDQHAAHERILFEKLKEQYKTRRLIRQSLLFPAVLELAPAESRLLARHKAQVAELGFEIEEFGGESFVVKAVPALLGHLPPAGLVEELFAQLRLVAEGCTEASHEPRLEAIFASMACKAAVKAGRRLAPEEIDTLLQQMRESRAFTHCPHGRPVVKSFSEADIKKWFFRN